ncbi:MAG: MFS transporter, partial [Nocardioidaceae bacterium]
MGQPRVTGYRWVVLAAFMAVNVTIQTLWISYAPITGRAEHYYGVSAVGVGALSMVFMLAYLPLAIPASWLIDRRGFRVASGAGALLAGVAGVVRGLVGHHYALVLVATIGAAVAQPLLLNAWTTVSGRWFARSQRATAVSLITLANLVGTGVGLALTPSLVGSLSIGSVQLVYGVAALAAGLVFVAVARERPAVAPEPDEEEQPALMLDGLRRAMRVRPFVLFLAMVFVAMGAFNGLSTWVEQILAPRGFDSVQAGDVGAMGLIGGVIGAVVLSTLSDRTGRRVPFLVLALGLGGPALAGVALATGLPAILGCAFGLGFFMTSAMPIGMQYAAEITWPTPAATSNGLVQLAGQASVALVYLMVVTRTPSGSFTPSLIGLAVLLVAGAAVASRLPEPRVHLDATGEMAGGVSGTVSGAGVPVTGG